MKTFGAIGSNQPIGASAFVRFLWQMDASSELGETHEALVPRTNMRKLEASR